MRHLTEEIKNSISFEDGTVNGSLLKISENQVVVKDLTDIPKEWKK